MASHYSSMGPDTQFGVTEYAPVPLDDANAPAASPNPRTPPAYPTQASFLDTDESIYDPVDKKAPNVFTRSVSSFFTKYSHDPPQYTRESQPKSFSWHLLGHVVSFLWIVPIVALLVLNITNHIIGPSAWCPGGRCPANVWANDAVARAKHLDENDHNTLGALQLVAKALEVWFMLIATALIYDLAMILARMEGGLPIGFLLTHLQFTDVRNLFNPHLWTSAIPQRGAPRSQQKSSARLMLFGVFAALLTILANLMGPAAAVLVLPTLRWIDTKHIPDQIYNGMYTDKSPMVNTAIEDCTVDQLTAGEYSCTYAPYAASLDHFAASALMTEMQYTKPFSFPLASTSQESAVQFLVNITLEDSLFWAANRQVLQDLSLDYFRLGDPQKYGHAATRLNDSLQVFLNRQGPSVGFNAECNTGNTMVVEVAKDKEIHCFSQWTTDAVTYYTKCFRVGVGFNAVNKREKFWIATSNASVPVDSTAVDVFFSDKAVLFTQKDDFGSGIVPCLNEDEAPKCDWDAIFSTPMPPEVRNMTQNVNVVSYSFYSAPNTTDTPKPEDRSRIFCDAVSYIGFPTYTLDTAPATNPLNLIRMQGLTLPKNSPPIVIDPTWFLASWSVDRNGTVNGYRQMAQELQKVLPVAWTSQRDPTSYFWQELSWLHLYSLTQTMSIIPFANTTHPSSPFASSAPNSHTGIPNKINGKDDPANPTLHTWATRHVWAYGIGQSRTSKLGVTVVTLGTACVLFRLLLGLTLGKREHSPVELFVAALEHQPRGEFEGVQDVREMAKVRFVMEEDEKEGRPRFVGEKGYEGDFGRKRRVKSGLLGGMGGRGVGSWGIGKKGGKGGGGDTMGLVGRGAGMGMGMSMGMGTWVKGGGERYS